METLYDRLKLKKPEAPHDAFKEELSPESIFSKLALLCFFFSIASVWFTSLRPLASVSFFGFLMFSLFYGFLRFKGRG